MQYCVIHLITSCCPFNYSNLFELAGYSIVIIIIFLLFYFIGTVFFFGTCGLEIKE